MDEFGGICVINIEFIFALTKTYSFDEPINEITWDWFKNNIWQGRKSFVEKVCRRVRGLRTKSLSKKLKCRLLINVFSENTCIWFVDYLYMIFGLLVYDFDSRSDYIKY